MYLNSDKNPIFQFYTACAKNSQTTLVVPLCKAQPKSIGLSRDMHGIDFSIALSITPAGCVTLPTSGAAQAALPAPTRISAAKPLQGQRGCRHRDGPQHGTPAANRVVAESAPRGHPYGSLRVGIGRIAQAAVGSSSVCTHPQPLWLSVPCCLPCQRLNTQSHDVRCKPYLSATESVQTPDHQN
jgi:hypothetical protein